MESLVSDSGGGVGGGADKDIGPHPLPTVPSHQVSEGNYQTYRQAMTIIIITYIIVILITYTPTRVGFMVQLCNVHPSR